MKDKLVELLREYVAETWHFSNKEYEDYVGKCANEILELFKPKTDWSKVDPEKFGELAWKAQNINDVFHINDVFPGPTYTNDVFAKGHWETDDAGYRIWVDDNE